MSIHRQSMEAVERYLTPEVIARIDRPTAEAAGLPNEAFTSPEFLELERKLLFTRTWMCAGFAHEISNSGDVMPVTIADVPIILARGQDSKIRAFHNVCRHRGTQLLAESRKSVTGLSCPYHGWTYDLEGVLKRRAHFEGPDQEGDLPDIHLFPVSCGEWENLIFVNIDGQAPPLDEFLAPMIRELEGYDFSTLVYAGEMTWELECNWKFVYENYIEPYHVPWCHPALDQFTPSNAHWFSVNGPCFVNRATFETGEAGRGAGLPYLPNLSGELSRRGTYIHLFPSCCLNLFPDHLAVFQLTLLAPNRTFERIALFLAPEAMQAEWEEGRRQLIDMWHQLNEEDIGIVERQQRGRASPPFDGGILSPFWDAPTTHEFARQVVAGMTA